MDINIPDIQQSLATYRRKVQEDNTFRKEEQKLAVFLETVERTVKGFQGLEQRERDLKAVVASLETRQGELERSISTFEQRLGNVKTEYDAKWAPFAAELAKIQAEIAAKQAEKASLEEGLAAFRRKHNL